MCPNSNCRNQNFAKRVICNLCGTSKPNDIRKMKSRSRDRKKRSRSRNRSSSVSSSSNSRYNNRNKDSKQQRRGGPFKEGDWQCESCKNINFAWRDKCNICKRNKPSDRNNDDRRRERGDNRNRRERDTKDDKKKRRRSRSLSEESLFSSKSRSSSRRKERRYSPSLSPKQGNSIAFSASQMINNDNKNDDDRIFIRRGSDSSN
jgi:hypothetical protein